MLLESTPVPLVLLTFMETLICFLTLGRYRLLAAAGSSSDETCGAAATGQRTFVLDAERTVSGLKVKDLGACVIESAAGCVYVSRCPASVAKPSIKSRRQLSVHQLIPHLRATDGASDVMDECRDNKESRKPGNGEK